MKKRWFVLTNTALDYYKSSERTAAKLGTLVLNSLCSVVQPDERVFKDTGKKRSKQSSAGIAWVELPEEGRVQEGNGVSCWDTVLRSVVANFFPTQTIGDLQRTREQCASDGSSLTPDRDAQFLYLFTE